MPLTPLQYTPCISIKPGGRCPLPPYSSRPAGNCPARMGSGASAARGNQPRGSAGAKVAASSGGGEPARPIVVDGADNPGSSSSDDDPDMPDDVPPFAILPEVDSYTLPFLHLKPGKAPVPGVSPLDMQRAVALSNELNRESFRPLPPAAAHPRPRCVRCCRRTAPRKCSAVCPLCACEAR
jgi:hypothetical protein